MNLFMQPLMPSGMGMQPFPEPNLGVSVRSDNRLLGASLAKSSDTDCKSITDNIAPSAPKWSYFEVLSGNRRRVAASEAIGAMLAIAMTLIAGAAAWGFVRSQAGNSEGALQDQRCRDQQHAERALRGLDMYLR